MKYRLFGGEIVFPEGTEKRDILVSGGKIEAIVDREAKVSEDYTPVDCGGYYISAGFIDIHQHGGGGSDYMDGSPEDYLNATDAHLAHGTTSVMPTLLSASKEDILHAVNNYKIAKNDPRIKSNLIGIHVEGP